MPAPLKPITYRGGLLRFQIPEIWTEEYPPEGGGVFYNPRDMSPTLRLNVITAQAPQHVNADTPAELLRPFSPAAQIQQLSISEAMIVYDTTIQERGQPLIIRTWQLCQALPPTHTRLANFTLTLLPGELEKLATLVAALDTEIRRAEFYPTLGALPTPTAKKPWWRFW